MLKSCAQKTVLIATNENKFVRQLQDAGGRLLIVFHISFLLIAMVVQLYVNCVSIVFDINFQTKANCGSVSDHHEASINTI